MLSNKQTGSKVSYFITRLAVYSFVDLRKRLLKINKIKRVLDKTVCGFLNEKAKRYANLVYSICVRRYDTGVIFTYSFGV